MLCDCVAGEAAVVHWQRRHELPESDEVLHVQRPHRGERNARRHARRLARCCCQLHSKLRLLFIICT